MLAPFLNSMLKFFSLIQPGVHVLGNIIVDSYGIQVTTHKTSKPRDRSPLAGAAKCIWSDRPHTREEARGDSDTRMLPVLHARRPQFLMDGVANHHAMVATTSTGANPCMCR